MRTDSTRRRTLRALLLLAGSLILALPVHARKAHVHGAGRLDVAIDKGVISISLELPLDVAVGFERAPRNDREKAELAVAEKALASGALFVPTPAADCRAEPVKLVLPAFGTSADRDAHGDIDASYAFRCARPAALRSIETGIFKSFRRLYRLEVQRIGPVGQGAQRLTPKNPVIDW